MMKRWQIAATLAVVGGLMAHAAAAEPCPGDLNGDGEVTVDEILVVVDKALNGCSAPAPTLTETASPTATVPFTPTPTATRSATVTRTPTPTPRFRDNGNGTVTDTTSGLVWEKKSDDGSVHDKDLQFSWSLSITGSSAPDGTAFTLFLPTLNGTRFAGFSDWRLPTLEELQTIVDRGAITPGAPLVPPAFNTNCQPGCSVTQCSCTTALNYWSASTNPANAQQAGYVLFNTGVSGNALKTLEFFVRGVRGP